MDDNNYNDTFKPEFEKSGYDTLFYKGDNTKQHGTLNYYYFFKRSVSKKNSLIYMYIYSFFLKKIRLLYSLEKI